MKIFTLLVLFILCTAQKCDKEPPPSWSGKLWKADGQSASIRWKNPDGDFDVIFADSEDFSNYVCTSIEDYVKIVDIIDSCQQWKRIITKKSNMKKLEKCFAGK